MPFTGRGRADNHPNHSNRPAAAVQCSGDLYGLCVAAVATDQLAATLRALLYITVWNMKLTTHYTAITTSDVCRAPILYLVAILDAGVNRAVDSN
jgi:hypothetical protein